MHCHFFHLFSAIFAGPRFIEFQKFCYHGNVAYGLSSVNSPQSANCDPPQEFDAKGESTLTTRLHDTLSVS